MKGLLILLGGFVVLMALLIFAKSRPPQTEALRSQGQPTVLVS